jgi:hypothetical protein
MPGPAIHGRAFGRARASGTQALVLTPGFRRGDSLESRDFMVRGDHRHPTR